MLYMCPHTAIYDMCPQVFSDVGDYTLRVDVYSGSLVVWYVFMGVPPLAALSGQEVLR